MNDDFLSPILGGLLIGLSSSALLFYLGKILGVSGIIGGIFPAKGLERSWRISFLLGLLCGGGVMISFFPQFTAKDFSSSPLLMMTAGLLVGFGTRLGSGCTSGHGVCGMARLSIRSIVSVFIFILTGMMTKYFI